MRLIFFFCLLPLVGITQSSQRYIVDIAPEQFTNQSTIIYGINGQELGTFSSPEKKTNWIKIPITATPFLAFSVVWKNKHQQANKIYYRFSDYEKEWTLLEPDAHHTLTEGHQAGKLIFASAKEQKVQLKISNNHALSGDIASMQLHFFSPGVSPTPNASPSTTLPQSCPCPPPNFLNRQAWCPGGNCPEHPNPQTTTVTHLIVHHAASTNTSSDWSAIVRSIWDFHVNTYGWDDIGYNWLIDPNGVVYQGRGDNIQGAHFCGANSGTVGICLLGNFTNTSPSILAVDQLEALLAWKACDIGIDPEGSAFHASSNQSLPSIAGHQEGCSTECPGDQFFPLFPQLRTAVKEYQAQSCEEFAPPTNLTAWATSASSIQLQWEDNTTSETNFLLERSKNTNNNYLEIAQLPANSTFFTDTNLNPFTAYFYRVRAASGNTYSEYSNEVGTATILSGAEEITTANNFVSINPNPSSGPLRIRIEGPARGAIRASMYDVTNGRIQQEWHLDKSDFSLEEILNFKKIGKGIFILRLELEEEEVYLKVLRQ